ncbi:MAG: UDP-N-acetylglucosamine 2-epimerase (non-hydrolyzing) [Nitrososphaeraceae archaeon]|jgi:UDP-N-acetylglucosamine 2-epimerase (non-hydrolysing)
MTFALITGTRPEIIKMIPLMKSLDSEGIDYKFIHTGQHHDFELFLKFIEDFNVKMPDYNINLTPSSGSIEQLSEMILKIGRILKELQPSSVIVQGDTNSVVASAFAAIKSRIPLVHVEAGLRSYDWRTPEEHNRRIVDHMSNVLFAPTTQSERNLRNEQVQGRIFMVGNTIVDAVELCMQLMSTKYCYNHSDKESILNKINLKIDPAKCVLLTLHREENVDNRDSLKQILSALADSGLHFVCPMHPRTVKRIHEFGLEDLISTSIKVIEPVGYFDLLTLLKICRFVISDSGGIQEEVTSPHINKHALILRDSTERPESIASGHTIMCPIDYNEIRMSIRKIELGEFPATQDVCPYGDGNSAHKIVEILKSPMMPIKCKVV